MQEIKLETFLEYKYLSNLQRRGDKLTFVETKADLENNNYLQALHELDPKTKEDKILLDFDKKFQYFSLNDGLYVVKNDENNKTTHTRFYKLEDGLKEAFTLPLAVSTIKDFNDEYYLVSATFNTHHPDYHLYDDKKKEALILEGEENKDYVVFDEYPFFFNGAGIINGNREGLFKVKKDSLEITRLTSPTMDVETFDFKEDTVLFSAVDFEFVKGKWPWVYEVNVETGDIKVLYRDKMQIFRVFYFEGDVICNGTFAKEYGAMETGKFYKVEGGQMHFVLESDNSFFNSVGSDCRYGSVKNYLKVNDTPYFITTLGSRAVVMKYTKTALEILTNFEGTADDLMLIDDELYVIAMKDQALQEVYAAKNNEVLTKINTVLDDKYVAVPNRIKVEKETPVDGWVLLPKDYDPTKKYPGILDIHGGPKCAYGEVFYHEMQVWANMGYFVFYCNPRGSDGKGNAFADLRHNYGKIDFEDIMDFTDAVLNAYPALDPKRLGVTGGSYGGFMTNWVIGHTDRFKAAASQRSISNWISEVCASDYGIDFPIEQEFDDLYSCQEELWEMSPLKYANNAKTPTLFIQATEDYRCPISEAIQMYTVLKCNGVPSKLVGFIGENHELSRSGKPLHRVKRLKEITDWLVHYINQ